MPNILKIIKTLAKSATRPQGSERRGRGRDSRGRDWRHCQDANPAAAAPAALFLQSSRQNFRAEQNEQQRRHDREMAEQARKADEARLKRESIDRQLQEGKQFMDQQNYSDAILQFKTVLKQDPRNVEAESWLKSAREKWGEVLLQKGKDLLDQGNYSDASAQFRAVLEQDPRNEAAQGGIAQAKEMWKESMLQQGKRWMKGGDYSRAIAQFQKVLGQDSNDKEAKEGIKKSHVLQGDDHLDKGEYYEALSNYQSGGASEKITNVLERVCTNAKTAEKEADKKEDLKEALKGYQKAESSLSKTAGYEEIAKALENIRAKIAVTKARINQEEAHKLIEETHEQVHFFEKRWSPNDRSSKKDLERMQRQLLEWQQSYCKATELYPPATSTCVAENAQLQRYLDDIKRRIGAIEIEELMEKMAGVESALRKYSLVQEEHLDFLEEQCKSWVKLHGSLESLKAADRVAAKLPVIQQIQQQVRMAKERIEDLRTLRKIKPYLRQLSEEGHQSLSTLLEPLFSTKSLRSQLLSLTEGGFLVFQEKLAGYLRSFTIPPSFFAKCCCKSDHELDPTCVPPTLKTVQEEWLRDIVSSHGQIAEVREQLGEQRPPPYNPQAPLSDSNPPSYAEVVMEAPD